MVSEDHDPYQAGAVVAWQNHPSKAGLISLRCRLDCQGGGSTKRLDILGRCGRFFGAHTAVEWSRPLAIRLGVGTASGSGYVALLYALFHLFQVPKSKTSFVFLFSFKGSLSVIPVTSLCFVSVVLS